MLKTREGLVSFGDVQHAYKGRGVYQSVYASLEKDCITC